MLKRVIIRFTKSSLTKSVVIYTFSSFLNSATPFLLLPVLTRLLTAEEYGILSMFNATSSFFVPFVGMSVSTAILRKVADGNVKEGKEYIYNCLIVVVGCTLTVSIIILLLSRSISKWTEIPRGFFPFLIIYTTSVCICNATQSLFQIQEKVKNYTIFQNLGTLFNLLLSIVLVVIFKMSLKGRIYGLTLSKLFFALIGLAIISWYVGDNRVFRLTYIKDVLLNFGLPMIPTEIKTTILTYTDKLFVTNMVSIGATGIYAVGNQFSMPLLILAQAFNLAFVPWLFKKLGEARYEEKIKIVKLTYAYFVIALSLAVLWTFISQFFLAYIAGKEYSGATAYVFWLSLGYAFTGMHMMVVNYIYYAKKLRLYAIVTAMVIFSNIVLNYILINSMGSVGAAIATCIANAISFILTWILSAHVCEMPWSLKSI